MVTRNDINKEFTTLVNTFIQEGYTFSPTMSGHQGEEMKVDLDNGKETVRIRLDRDSETNWETGFYANYMILVAETFDKVGRSSWDTLWNGKGKTIYSQTYYEFREGVYTTNKQEVQDRIDKRHARSKAKKGSKDNYNYLLTPRATLIAYRFIRKQAGCKTKRPEDIVSITRCSNSRGVYYRVNVASGKGTRVFDIK